MDAERHFATLGRSLVQVNLRLTRLTEQLETSAPRREPWPDCARIASLDDGFRAQPRSGSLPPLASAIGAAAPTG